MSRGTRRGLLSARPSVWYFRCSSSGNNSVVECDLAKVEVAGSNPVSRSIIYSRGPLAPLGTLRCVGPGCPLRCACFSGSGGRWPRSARSAAWVPIAHSAARASEEAEAAGPARRAPRRGSRLPTPLRVLLRKRRPLAPIARSAAWDPDAHSAAHASEGERRPSPRSARSAAWDPIAHSAARASEEAEAARRATVLMLGTDSVSALRDAGLYRPQRSRPRGSS